MRINLLYNKIVADTVKEGFIESFNTTALPILSEKYPNAEEVVIYEDYLSDGLFQAGTFFCPLTIVSEGSLSRAFASWRYDSKKFEDAIPYSYIGKDILDIAISETAPPEIEAKVAGRVPFFAKNAIGLTVNADAPTKIFLSGRYSQSFIDVLRDNITFAIEKEFGIEGAKDSTLELSLEFAPQTFMEHVLDNVSYRRILISAKACAPRDLWIKWTRLDGNGTYTVSSHVKESDVLFELCDEVPEKIREREYRYLIKLNGMSAYKNAMSRKNFTEWRELIKRVIKRGEVVKLDEACDEVLVENVSISPFDLIYPAQPAIEKEDAFDSEISLKLQSVLENYDIETDSYEESPEEDINPDITELLRTLLAGNSEENMDTGEDLPEESEEVDELPSFDIEEEYEEKISPEDEPFSEEIFDEDDASIEQDELPQELITPEEESIEDSASEESAPIFGPLSDFEYDNTQSEKLLEKEREISELKEINEALTSKLAAMEAEQAKYAELIVAYEKEAEEIRRERAMFIETLDASKRREEREKDRLAEAAKIAVAERYNLEQPVDIEDEEEKKNEEKLLEEARIKEAEEAARLHEVTKLEEARILDEREKRTSEYQRVNYVSKIADISFRHPVDPNITKRIQEIIVTTVKYFNKEDVYMKIKATIPDPYMVRLEFVKIPENESELLSDIIRVLGHSKIGITKVLLD